MQDLATILTYYSGTYPDVLAIDSTGAATQDGTEIIAALLNNISFGPLQALMDYAGLTPDGVTEAAGTAQFLEAIEKGFGVGPGKLVGWFIDDTPTVTGDRVLLLQGQGVLVNSYLELDAKVYVGDANNAAVAAGGGFFYRSSDAAGTTPNIAGPYLQLPDARGYVFRGLDVAAAVDPGGASRFLGDVQLDAMQGHIHNSTGATFIVGAVAGAGLNYNFGTATISSPVTDGVNGAPRTASESRGANRSVHWGITY